MKLKPAEEWCAEMQFDLLGALVIIRAIQADAFAAGVHKGMTDAAEVAKAMQESPYTSGNWIFKAILAARDKKTTDDMNEKLTD